MTDRRSGASAHVDTFTADRLPPSEQWPVLLRDLPAIQYSATLNASVELLDRTVEQLGTDRTAVIADDGTWTYGQLLSDVRAAAALLRDVGVQPGNRVVLRGPNNGRLVVAWLASLRVGAVVVTTIPLLRTGELDGIIDICEPQFAVVDYRYLDEWNATRFNGTTISYGDGSADSMEVRGSSASGSSDAVDTAATDTALLAFTSGTTGRPKATMHAHQDILAIADTFSAQIVKPTSDDVFSGSPPLAFTFGLGGLVVFPLRVGASSVLLESGSPPNLLTAIDRHNITCLFTAPTAYRAMLSGMKDHDISSLRRCVSAGETLPEATWQAWFDATGMKLIDGIGATEMLHIFISASDDDIRPGRTGRAVPGYRAEVVDDDMQPLPPHTPGRLAVRGPTGCRYLADDRQMVYVRDGWNLTGDIYEKDNDGYFRYIARADDMIVSSGYNIAAPEVENALLTHAAVAETAVVGTPDPDRGMLVTAYVVLNPEFSPSDDLRGELQDHVKATIAPYKYPRVLEFVDALPKTATGKLQRFRLKT
jgi:2-aminobenzoate-CoA ligase